MESLETQIYRWRCPMIWQYYLKRNVSRDRLLLLASEPLHHGSVRMQQDVVQSHTFGCRKSSFICHSLSLSRSLYLSACFGCGSCVCERAKMCKHNCGRMICTARRSSNLRYNDSSRADKSYLILN